jgi:gluconolactonase
VTELYTIHDKRFRRYALANATLETLATGLRWLEGPVWFADHATLLFSDIPNDRIMRLVESNGAVDIFRAPAGYPNGAARDRAGRLIHCHHGDRSITRTHYNGTIETLADRYQGRRLNSPNDVTVKSDGTIWFTDPNYGLLTDYQGNRAEQELKPALYRFNPQDGALTLMTDAFTNPNGLCFSPDESLLYVSETGDLFGSGADNHIAVMDVLNDAQRLSDPRRFAKISPGNADGFKCDEDGNLWSSAEDGVHCLDPGGALLGVIHTPSLVSNLCFGGRKSNRLFLCASQTLFAIYVNTRGAQCG